MLYEMTLIFTIFVSILMDTVGDELLEYKFLFQALDRFILAISQFIYGYSMYLMMDHNVTEYVKFLKVVQKIKLHWLCCKWRYFVMEELKKHDKDLRTLSLEAAQSNSTISRKNNNNEQSRFEATKESVNDQRIEINELSVPTTTIVN